MLVLHYYERKDMSLTYLNYNLSGSYFPWITPENKTFVRIHLEVCGHKQPWRPVQPRSAQGTRKTTSRGLSLSWKCSVLLVHPGRASLPSQKYGGINTLVGSRIVDISSGNVTHQTGSLRGSKLRDTHLVLWMVVRPGYVSCSCGLSRLCSPKRQFASRLLDATRLSDSKYVVLKLVKKYDHPFEVEIGQFLSSEPLAGASENHCIPIYDVLHVPGDSETRIIVMPLLLEYMHPPFDTFGEAVECFRQLFEVSFPGSLQSDADCLCRASNSRTSIMLHIGL